MEINFLKGRRKQFSKLQQQDNRWFRFSLIGLGTVFGVFVVVLGIRLWLAYSVGEVKNRQENLKAQIKTLEENERSYVLFAAKVKVLSELLAQRKDKQQAIKDFSSLFGPNILISDISYAAEESLLSFGVQAPSVFALEEVFTKLQDPALKERFAEVKKSELKRGSDGKYSIQVTITLKQ